MFLTNIDMDYGEYLKCISSHLKGDKVFIKRRPCETRINQYNKDLLTAWQANMDMQFCIDPWAIINYIVKYMCKGERGMSTLMQTASDNARDNNRTLSQEIRDMGKVWTNQTEIPIQEAIAYVLQLPFRVSSRTFIFINSSPTNERCGLLKSTEILQNMNDECTDIFSDNAVKRYARRPLELKDWCLADFATKLNYITRSRYKPKNKYDPDKWLKEEKIDSYVYDNAQETDSDCDILENDNAKSTSRIVYELDSGYLIPCRKQKILRYVKFSKERDAEKYYFEQLFLFFPWVNEENDFTSLGPTYEDAYNSVKDIVTENAKQYNLLTEILNDAMETAEKDYGDIEDSESSDNETQADDSSYACFDPNENLQINNDENYFHNVKPANTSTIALPNVVTDDEFRSMVRNMNKEQKLYFDHVIHRICTSDDAIYNFCTSGAGCGKTYLLKTLYQALIRLFSHNIAANPEDITVLLMSFTGKASYNIRGNTIHSSLGINAHQPLRDYKPLDMSSLNTYVTRLHQVKVIIIDECSMISNALFRYIDLRLQDIMGKNKPFGGVSVICFGDLYQLPPTHYGQIFSDLKLNPDASCVPTLNLWKELFTIYELKSIMRQQDDEQFANILNRLREGLHTDTDINTLQTMCLLNLNKESPDYPIKLTHLYYTNVKINEHNKWVHNQMNSSEKTEVIAYDIVQGSPPNSIRKTILSQLSDMKSQLTRGFQYKLQLSLNVRYELLQNLNCPDGLANGSSGILKFIDRRMQNYDRPSILWLKFDEPDIGRQQRQKYKHLYQPKIEQNWTPIMESKIEFQVNKHRFYKVLRRQFPLRCASAKSIHRSQGDTLEDYVIDFTGIRAVPALHYVGLSRATSLCGLKIVNLNPNKITVDKTVHDEMKRLRQHRKLQFSISYQPCTLPDNFFTITFHNVQSLHKYYSDIKADYNMQSSQVICFAQTRLLPSEPDTKYAIPGYNVSRIDSCGEGNDTTRNVYGLALYHRNCVKNIKNYKHHYRNQIVYFQADVPQPIHCICVYRSPSTNVNSFLAYLKNILQDIPHNQPILIMGDFNINSLENKSQFRQLKSTMQPLHLALNDVSTVFGSAIDQFWTNIRQDVYLSNSFETHYSDHKPIHFTLLSDPYIQ